jgi:hypothetical protein
LAGSHGSWRGSFIFYIESNVHEVFICRDLDIFRKTYSKTYMENKRMHIFDL